MSTITASDEQRVVDEAPKQLYIAGEWRDGAKGTIAVEDPSTGETIAEVADASPEDAQAALDAAVAKAGRVARAPAPRAWRDPPPGVRDDRRSARMTSRC